MRSVRTKAQSVVLLFTSLLTGTIQIVAAESAFEDEPLPHRAKLKKSYLSQEEQGALIKGCTPAETMPSSPSAFSVATGQTDGCMFYLSYLSRKIKMNWFPPRICQGYIPTVATFKIRSDGNLSDVRIVQSSGISIADNAALAAIKNAAPFGSLLQGWPPEVEIQFRFDYNVFRQKSEAAIRTLSHKQILLDSCAE